MSASSFAAPAPTERLYIVGLRVALYAVSILLYLIPIASWFGITAAIIGSLCGMRLAGVAYRRQLRLTTATLLSMALFLLALFLGDCLQNSVLFTKLLGVGSALTVSEAISLGLAALLITFLLRLLASAVRSLTFFEVSFVAGSVVTLLVDHRNRMLNRPRFFSDWAWSFGLDPVSLLVAIGISATLLAILLFLRGQPLVKTVSTLLLLILLGSAFYLVWNKRLVGQDTPDPLGLSGKKGSAKGQGSNSKSPFSDDYSSANEPSPVAIAILRDDLKANTPLLYFRQTALSYYNGHHLVSGIKQNWDRDLLSSFPTTKPISAQTVQNTASHLDLPTTMYLLIDHPQPVALSHAKQIRPVKNPNPQQFVAAYDVSSQILSVEAHRLLGRTSIPQDWSASKRRHYLMIPPDPRYQALSDIIVRDVDPRFSEDDLAKAFAIKSYLEKQGFYTRRSTHTSANDPAASFLFGSLRGYCVHFAHAAVFLLRSQGIASRVALGYAVQLNKRSGGSTLLIMSDRAHAWPEIYLSGIGWVTFDIYPERTDLPPPTPVDYDLEKLLGELARVDPTSTIDQERTPLRIPWKRILHISAIGFLMLLTLAYLVKISRRLAPRLSSPKHYTRRAYLALLDQLSDYGFYRQVGETRENHAARMISLVPNFELLTREHLACAFGGHAVDRSLFDSLVCRVKRDVKQNFHPLKRAFALLNPVGWIFTR